MHSCGYLHACGIETKENQISKIPAFRQFRSRKTFFFIGSPLYIQYHSFFLSPLVLFRWSCLNVCGIPICMIFLDRMFKRVIMPGLMKITIYITIACIHMYQGCGSVFIFSGSGSRVWYWSPIRIRIQYGSRALMTKNWKKIQLKIFLYFFYIKNCNLPIPRPP